MIRKILIAAMVILTFAICGCSQQLPPSNDPPQIDTQPTPPPENPTPPIKTQIPPEPPQIDPEPVEPIPEPPETVTPVVQSQQINLKLYFPDDAGINLVAINRSIEIKNDAEKYSTAVQLLMKNPGEKDLTVIFPKNAKVNGVNVENGTAFVDFDKNILKSFVGGSTGEELLVNSVVKTLTEFPEIKQVRFLVDGKEIETLSGHMDLSEPIRREDL